MCCFADLHLEGRVLAQLEGCAAAERVVGAAPARDATRARAEPKQEQEGRRGETNDL